MVRGATSMQEMASISQPTTPRRTLSCSAEMLLDLVSSPAEMTERKRSRRAQRVASADRFTRGASADGVARGATDARVGCARSLLMPSDCAAPPSVHHRLLAEPSKNAVTLLLRIIDSLRSE